MPGALLHHRTWLKSAPDITDQVSVKNVSVRACVGLDAWGREREQTVFISIILSLKTGFISAAGSDTVDGSTVHYGLLTKDITNAINQIKNNSQSQAIGALAHIVMDVVLERVRSAEVLSLCEIDVYLPKASLSGDGLSLLYSVVQETGDHSRVLRLNKLRLFALLGVNDYERTAKQPVVVDVTIDRLVHQIPLDFAHELEKIISKQVESSSFKTLEALVTRLVEGELIQKVQAVTPGAGVRLRVEKPAAIATADGPAVEIYRITNVDDKVEGSGTTISA